MRRFLDEEPPQELKSGKVKAASALRLVSRCCRQIKLLLRTMRKLAWSLLPWLLLVRRCVCFVATRQGSFSLCRLSAQEDPSPNEMMQKAEKLREEIESFEASKKAAEDELRQQAEAVQAEQRQLRERYSAVVPILKPDGSTQEERCDFSPRWKEGSRILVCEARLPIGVILGESETLPKTTVIDEVGSGSNGEVAGLQVGDLVRAFTACKVEMSMPTWQLIAGGIGVPKTKRFMYSADGRPFEEVMEGLYS